MNILFELCLGHFTLNNSRAFILRRRPKKPKNFLLFQVKVQRRIQVWSARSALAALWNQLVSGIGVKPIDMKAKDPNVTLDVLNRL